MQKKAAEIVVEKVRSAKKRISKGEVLKEAGYSAAMQIVPAKVFESPGFKEELVNFGLTEDLIKTALVDDIQNKPRKRFLELSLGAEILGLKKQGSQGGGYNVQVNVLNFTNNNPAQVRSENLPTEGATSD